MFVRCILLLLLAFSISCGPSSPSELENYRHENIESDMVFFDLPGKMTYHLANERFVGVLAPDRTYGCDAYGGRLPTEEEYHQHFRSHTGGKSYWMAEGKAIASNGMSQGSTGEHSVLCVKTHAEPKAVHGRGGSPVWDIHAEAAADVFRSQCPGGASGPRR